MFEGGYPLGAEPEGGFTDLVLSSNVTGVSATASAGFLTVTGNSSTTVTGMMMNGALGFVTASGGASTTVTGVTAAGGVSLPSVWTDVIDSQTPSWSVIVTK